MTVNSKWPPSNLPSLPSQSNEKTPQNGKGKRVTVLIQQFENLKELEAAKTVHPHPLSRRYTKNSIKAADAVEKRTQEIAENTEVPQSETNSSRASTIVSKREEVKTGEEKTKPEVVEQQNKEQTPAEIKSDEENSGAEENLSSTDEGGSSQFNTEENNSANSLTPDAKTKENTIQRPRSNALKANEEISIEQKPQEPIDKSKAEDSLKKLNEYKKILKQMTGLNFPIQNAEEEQITISSKRKSYLPSILNSKSDNEAKIRALNTIFGEIYNEIKKNDYRSNEFIELSKNFLNNKYVGDMIKHHPSVAKMIINHQKDALKSINPSYNESETITPKNSKYYLDFIKKLNEKIVLTQIEIYKDIKVEDKEFSNIKFTAKTENELVSILNEIFTTENTLLKSLNSLMKSEKTKEDGKHYILLDHLAENKLMNKKDLENIKLFLSEWENLIKTDTVLVSRIENIYTAIPATDSEENKATLGDKLGYLLQAFMKTDINNYYKLFYQINIQYAETRAKFDKITNSKKLEEFKTLDQQDILDLLIQPIQRLPRIELLFSQLKKTLERSDVKDEKTTILLNALQSRLNFLKFNLTYLNLVIPEVASVKRKA